MQRVGGEDLVEEAGVDHGGLGPVRPNQVHRLGHVLLSLRRALGNLDIF